MTKRWRRNQSSQINNLPTVNTLRILVMDGLLSSKSLITNAQSHLVVSRKDQHAQMIWLARIYLLEKLNPGNSLHQDLQSQNTRRASVSFAQMESKHWQQMRSRSAKLLIVQQPLLLRKRFQRFWQNHLCSIRIRKK